MRYPAACRGPTAARPRHQRGFSLIEVMVSVLILGIGLLGIAAMQATALKNSQSSLERSQAVIQAYAIVDAMRANRDVALAGGYALSKACATSGVSTTGLAGNDQKDWVTSLQNTLGSGSCGTIAYAADATGAIYTVTITWDDSRAKDTGSGQAVVSGDSAHDFVMKARI